MPLEAPRNVMVIGLGGSGQWVLTYLKQSLIEASNHWIVNNSDLASLDPNYGSAIPEGIKLLCLDINSAEEIVLDDDIKLDYDPATTDEFADFSETLAAIKNYVTGSKIDPTIGPWFESDDSVKLTLPISQRDITGAGQQRQYCRLCFLKSLTNRNNPRRLDNILPGYFNYFGNRQAQMPNIENYFIIVGSLAGGTGSGCILDVAQMLKYFIQQGAVANSTIIGISVLSEAFASTFANSSNLQWDLVQSNCIAAMREIQRFLVLKGLGYPFLEYKGNWNPNPPLSDKQIPFDAYYIVDGTRVAGGSDLTKFKETLTVFPAIADYILTFCSQNQRSFDPANTRNIISNTEDGVYSTLGCHTWILPVEDIIHDFSIQLAGDFIRYLKGSLPPSSNIRKESEDFLKNSNIYYSQNSPLDEYALGQTMQSEKFSFLDDILDIVTQYERRATAIPCDVDYFKEVIFAPNKFPRRFIDPRINVNLMENYHLPYLNLDIAGLNESDQFIENDHIKQSSEPSQVIDLAEKLMHENLGTTNDPAYDTVNPDLKRTYHGILKYYQKLANEIFGGYQSIKGHYCPGLLENKIYLLLNEVKESKPKEDSTTRQPIKGTVTGNPLFEVTYQTREFSISLASTFCMELLNVLQKAKDAIDQSYEMLIRPDGQDQELINEEERNRRKEEYENARWSRFKKNPYLEAMQRLLYSKRLVIMKRHYTAILEDFMAITRGWKETLENFEKGITNIGGDLAIRLDRFRKHRRDRSLIQTRTYISNPQSELEKDLYEKHIHAKIKEAQRHGQWVNITKEKEFFYSSLIEMVQKMTDVNSRREMKRTGRELRVSFFTEKKAEVFSCDAIIKQTKFFCQSVRNESFWEILFKYRDENQNLRYLPSQAMKMPAQLTSDIVRNSHAFVDYRDTLRATSAAMSQQQLDHNNITYAYWVTPDASVMDMVGFQSNLNRNNFPRGTQYNASTEAGQQYRLTALQQIFCLTRDSFANYLTNCNTYRNWLRSLISSETASSTIGTPVHNFLGEKYAARYELMISDHWGELGLNREVQNDFFLPLELVFAFENKEALKDFLWLGVYFKRLFWRRGMNRDEFTIEAKGNFISLHNDGKPGLLGAIVKFTMSDDPQISGVRMEINQLRGKTFMEEINKSRSDFTNKLKELMKDPLNNLVRLSGTTDECKKIIDPSQRSESPRTMSKEEKLELLFKAFILEQMTQVQ